MRIFDKWPWRSNAQESMLEELDDQRIIRLSVLPDRRLLQVTERCDEHFSGVLNKQQVLQLASEIRALGKSMKHGGVFAWKHRNPGW